MFGRSDLEGWQSWSSAQGYNRVSLSHTVSQYKATGSPRGNQLPDLLLGNYRRSVQALNSVLKYNSQ